MSCEAMMNDHSGEPRALFPAYDGSVYPDTLICSGILPAELGGKPCPFSENGRLPLPRPLDPSDPSYSIDKGKPAIFARPAPSSSLVALAIGRGMALNNFPPICCRCACSSAVCGSGLW